MEKRPNPMERALEALKTAPKCLAHARTTGEPCKNASMANGRCRMHGGKSTGRPITHGLRTKINIENVAKVKYLINKINLIQ
jgi:hypothetical protein